MEIIPEIQKEDVVREEKVRHAEQAYRLAGSIRFVKGLRVYSYNFHTKELKEIQPEKEIQMTIGSTSNHHKIKVEENCAYFQALNWKSAERKIARLQLK